MGQHLLLDDVELVLDDELVVDLAGLGSLRRVLVRDGRLKLGQLLGLLLLGRLVLVVVVVVEGLGLQWEYEEILEQAREAERGQERCEYIYSPVWRALLGSIVGTTRRAPA